MILPAKTYLATSYVMLVDQRNYYIHCGYEAGILDAIFENSGLFSLPPNPTPDFWISSTPDTAFVVRQADSFSVRKKEKRRKKRKRSKKKSAWGERASMGGGKFKFDPLMLSSFFFGKFTVSCVVLTTFLSWIERNGLRCLSRSKFNIVCVELQNQVLIFLIWYFCS